MLRPDGPPALPAGGEPRARFGRANRLVRGWQYQRTFREGRSERGECVVAYAHVVPGEPSRVGIIASRKVGNAVLRNRAKRRLREVARALWPRVPGDGRQVVLIALAVVPTVDFARLESDVARLMRNLGVLET
jgi:ribonuclease P protein component